MAPAHQRNVPLGCMETKTKDLRIDAEVGGKYRVVRKLGCGGMGTVYEAEHVVVGRRVAIKFLHQHYSDRRCMVQRFLREAKAAGSLRSDHLIGACDYGEWQGGPYLVMDLYRGSDLREVMRARPRLPLEQALRIAIDVCRGLQVAHDAGLVHRDLKPANIFIARRCNGETIAKVLDFGVAKLSHAQDLSDEGTLVGTLGYMAPEQLMGSEALDGRADLHALGVILYQMLAGRPPYHGERGALVRDILTGSPPRLEVLCPELPRGLCDVIHATLATTPNGRPNTARDLMLLLSHHLPEGSQQIALANEESPVTPCLLESASTVLQSASDTKLSSSGSRIDMTRSALVLSVGALVLSLVAVTTMFVFVYSQGRVAVVPGAPTQPAQAPSSATATFSLQSAKEETEQSIAEKSMAEPPKPVPGLSRPASLRLTGSDSPFTPADSTPLTGSSETPLSALQRRRKQPE